MKRRVEVTLHFRIDNWANDYGDDDESNVLSLDYRD